MAPESKKQTSPNQKSLTKQKPNSSTKCLIGEHCHDALL